MSKTILLGSITIPIDNIDYVDTENCWIKLKSGNRILCSQAEAEWAANQL